MRIDEFSSTIDIDGTLSSTELVSFLTMGFTLIPSSGYMPISVDELSYPVLADAALTPEVVEVTEVMKPSISRTIGV